MSNLDAIVAPAKTPPELNAIKLLFGFSLGTVLFSLSSGSLISVFLLTALIDSSANSVLVLVTGVFSFSSLSASIFTLE